MRCRAIRFLVVPAGLILSGCVSYPPTSSQSELRRGFSQDHRPASYAGTVFDKYVSYAGTVERIVSTSVPTSVSTSVPTSSAVAENGSYFGEISAITNRPKTVFVSGYYRKDGMYVRSHYRSLPRGSTAIRGPPLVSDNLRFQPNVAENDSYYGEISVNTGRPKTVHVRGYYRKDGTYVRGHYRSKPRR